MIKPKPNKNALRSINIRSISDTRIPAIGMYGYNGTLKDLSICGLFILSLITARLMKANPKIEANPAT